ncbi:MAG: integrin alpha [Chthoniobacteraceae bacterium]
MEALESRIAPAAIVQLSGLTGLDGFTLQGVDGGDETGYSVSGAGDVNGDGFSDVIVGAPVADGGVGSSGVAYVVFGTDQGFAAAIDLGALDGNNGFQIHGENLGDSAGISVGMAGDVNHDGFDDLIVGASDANANGLGSGAAFVIFGSSTPAATVDLAALDGTNGFKIIGATAGDYAGASVSGAGDLNLDGFADVIIGASGANGGAGATFVLFGKGAAFAPEIMLATLNGTDGVRINGEAEGDESGTAVSGAGDVNGDGFADVIIGAPGAYAPKDSSGASYVVFGKAGPWSASLDLVSLNGSNGFKLNGVSEYDYSGSAVGGAGDINGDGFDDVIIGASQASPNGAYSGAAYVVFGKPSFGAKINLSSLNGSNGFKLSGGAKYDYAGFSVSGAGDVNGDGIADLIVGATGASPNGDTEGASYVVFGKKNGFSANMKLSNLPANKGIRIHGPNLESAAGSSVHAAGDVNGDGIDDIIVGAYAADGIGSGAGAAYVVFGTKDIKGDLPPPPGTYIISANGKTATYTDLDGDTFLIKLGGGILSPEMIRLNAEGYIELIDLTGQGASGARGIADKSKPLKLSIVLTEKAPGGDGLLDIGTIDATGVALSSLQIDGDLSALFVGSDELVAKSKDSKSKSGMKSLRVHSMGMGASHFASLSPTMSVPGGIKKMSVQDEMAHVRAKLGSVGKLGVKNLTIGASLSGSTLEMPGGMKKMKVTKNVADTSMEVGKNWRSLAVLGEITDSEVIVTGTMRILIVRGDVTDSLVAGPGAAEGVSQQNSTVFSRVEVGGNFVRSQLVAGYDGAASPVNGSASLGKITIKGDFSESSIAAGVDAGPDGFFGTGDDALIDAEAALIGQIASITIKGRITGSPANPDDGFGIVAEEIRSLSIQGRKISMNDGARSDTTPVPLGSTADVISRELDA